MHIDEPARLPVSTRAKARMSELLEGAAEPADAIGPLSLLFSAAIFAADTRFGMVGQVEEKVLSVAPTG